MKKILTLFASVLLLTVYVSTGYAKEANTKDEFPGRKLFKDVK